MLLLEIRLLVAALLDYTTGRHEPFPGHVLHLHDASPCQPALPHWEVGPSVSFYCSFK